MPGKEADLVLVEGNPLKDLTSLARVRMVLKHGKIAKNPVKEA
jgi:imidazolonepropionase-like amidohydrolase